MNSVEVLEDKAMYWEAAVLGVAFVALLLGSLGLIIIICHTYRRSRKAREESRKIRGAELYDSIVVKSESDSDHNYKSDSKIKPKKSLLVKGDSELVQATNQKPVVRMPGEMGGTMSKAMSYDVNPIYSL